MANNLFQYYENVPGIIGVKTNCHDFFWGFGKCAAPVSQEVFDRCRIKVFLDVRADRDVFRDISPGAYTCDFRHFKVAPEQGSLLFDQTVKKALHLRYVLTVTDDTVRLTVGKTYFKTIRTKLMYVHPVAYILFDVAALLLLRHGMTTLYCSAVRFSDGRSAVFMAPPNTGKSLCALKLRKDFGAKIVAEDMAVTDGTSLWGAPDTNLYRNYKDNSLMDFDRAEGAVTLDKVDYLAILQKADVSAVESPDEFEKKLLLLNRYSLGYYYSPCIRALGYYNRSISVADAESAEERILQQLQSNADCVLMKNNDPMQFSAQIMSYIN